MDLGQVWATLSQFLKHFILQIKFCQLILENGDDCLDKTFATILKNKIGFNKNNYLLSKKYAMR